jgi:hypothetical protein
MLIGPPSGAAIEAVSAQGAVRRTARAEALAHALADAREEAYSRLRSGRGRTVFPERSDTGLPIEIPSPEARDASAAAARILHALAAEARDPNASPEQLTHLAAEARRFAPRREQNPVYDALAANPNTPPDLLAFLMPLCPVALAANPVLPLLPLEMPDFTARVPRRDRFDLLRRGDLPASLARLLRTDPDPEVAESAALHLAIAGEIAPADKARETEFREYLRTRATRPEEIHGLAELSAAGMVPDWLLPRRPDTLPVPSAADATRLQRLAVATLAGSPLPAPSKGDDCRPLIGVARYLALRSLLGDPASRRLVPDSATADPDFLVRLALAESLPAGRDTDLLRLSRDGNRFVRAAANSRRGR